RAATCCTSPAKLGSAMGFQLPPASATSNWYSQPACCGLSVASPAGAAYGASGAQGACATLFAPALKPAEIAISTPTNNLRTCQILSNLRAPGQSSILGKILAHPPIRGLSTPVQPTNLPVCRRALSANVDCGFCFSLSVCSLARSHRVFAANPDRTKCRPPQSAALNCRSWYACAVPTYSPFAPLAAMRKLAISAARCAWRRDSS